ncbi:MAG: VOC family protein [Anaerolineae bacterium]
MNDPLHPSGDEHMTTVNAVNWFEIPVQNMERAAAFYSALVGKPVNIGEFGGMPHGFLPSSEDGVGGALVVGPHLSAAGSGGVLVYLNANDDIDGALQRAQAAGGKIVMGKTAIPPQGYIAAIVDSEGNRVGLHEAPRE